MVARLRPMVMIVESDLLALESMSRMLGDHYDLSFAVTGQECIDLSKAEPPDLVLLELKLADMHGFEVCKRLKADPASQEIPVLVVTSGLAPESRLEGYECGAIDYIVKPYALDSFLARVATALQHCVKMRALQNDASEAMQTAYEAMTATSEMGAMLQLVNRCTQQKTIEDLAAFVIDALTGLGVQPYLNFVVDGEAVYFGCQSNSIEAEAMEKCSGHQKIVDLGSRTIFNESLISIFISDMPLDDTARYGRIKDNVAVLANVANSQLISLSRGMALQAQQSGMIQALALSKQNAPNCELDELLDDMRAQLCGLELKPAAQHDLLRQLDKISQSLNALHADNVPGEQLLRLQSRRP